MRVEKMVFMSKRLRVEDSLYTGELSAKAWVSMWDH